MTSITFRQVASGNGTTSPATVTVPTGTATGDVMIACVGSTDSSTAASHTWPGSWTVLNTATASSFTTGLAAESISVAMKPFATGDTSFSVTISSISLGSWASVCMSYTGVAGGAGATSSSAFNDHKIGSPRGSSSAALTTPTVGTAGSLYRVDFWMQHDTSVPSWTPASDTNRSNSSNSTGTYLANVEGADSNGMVIVGGGGTSTSATPNATHDGGVAWCGLLIPSSGLTSKIYDVTIKRAAYY